ncbi:MAG TPA: MlaD family protein [Gemmatimonadaceae bacterium]|nr:MlaD family protein [Gemmatimonadaceae bacterium]
MKRSTAITWDQLKVGLMIVVALAIMIFAVVKLGQAANLFEERYELVTFVPNASGLVEGGQVTVAGQLAGGIKKIEFLPPDADTSRNLKITMELSERLQPQVRENSFAKIRTLGLLGNKVLDISVGTPQVAALEPGDTVRISPSLDYEAVIAQASGAVGDLVELTHDLREITGGIVRGEGTVGQLLTSRTLYDQLTSTLTETSGLLRRMQQPNGTFGRMLEDPELYYRMVSVTASLDTVLKQMNNQQGTVGRLLADDSLYVRMVSVTASADSMMKMLTQGNGFAARMISDQELYDRLNKTITDLSTILEDIRKNPRKYTKGMIKVF